ncbi:MAG: DUF2147 domain-containing protein [Brumimicrobium sp.]|nr:DUF2147 domain-containing protein [Brumimicrobium sp.]
MKLYLLFIFLLISIFGFSYPIEGIWFTYSDETGELKSKVRLYVEDGRLYGEILELYNKREGIGDNPKCIPCPGDKKNKPVIGMEFIMGLTRNEDGEWTGEDGILEPKTGDIYDCVIWLKEDGSLAVRGYIGWFYRTQYWHRSKQ